MAKRNQEVETGAADVAETENVPENSGLSEQQTALLTSENVPETEQHKPSFDEIKAAYEDTDNTEFTWERVAEHVSEGNITPEQFREITGLDYDETSQSAEQAHEGKEAEASKEATTTEPGPGHNLPPKTVDPIAEELREELSHYKPVDATDSTEATEHAREAVEEAIEYLSKADTSLRATLSIRIADWLFFNAEGLASNGNKLVTVSRDLYKQTLSKVSDLVPKEDITPTVTSTIGSGIEGAILMMAGKAKVGYFGLAPDRRAVRGNDVASPEYPSDLPDGYKVLRGVCIASNVLQPKGITILAGGNRQEVENTSTDLVLLPQYAQKALFDSLWDKDGEIEYNPLTGVISSFLSGKDVAARNDRERVKAEKAKAEQEAKTKADAQAALNPPELTNAEKRDTGGSVDQDNLTSVSMQTIRSLINKNGLTDDEMATLRKGFAELDQQLLSKDRELSALRSAAEGDIWNGIPSIRSEIRMRGINTPVKQRIDLLDCLHDLCKRVYMATDKPMTKEEAMHAILVKRDLDVLLEDLPDSNGVIVKSPETDQPLVTYDVAAA